MRVGIVQLRSAPSAVRENLERALRLCEEAASKEAELICLHENWLGAVSLSQSQPIPGEATLCLGDVAKRYGCYVVAGAIWERSSNGICYVSSPIIGPSGEVVGVHRKVHLYRDEKHMMGRGSGFEVHPVRRAKIGVLICYDVNFPESARVLALKGADLIVVPSKILSTGIPEWHLYLKARALENRIPVVGINGVGSGILYGMPIELGGRCIAIMPRLEVGGVVKLDRWVEASESEEVLMVDIDLEELREARAKRLSERVPNLYNGLGG